MSALGSLPPPRQRRVLALIGVDVYATRPAPALAPLAVRADPSDPLVAAIVRGLGVSVDAARFATPADPMPKARACLSFGTQSTGAADAVHLDSLERLRGSGAAKREAWRSLRRLARRLAES